MGPTFRSYSLFALQFLAVFAAYFFSARWGLSLHAINDFAALIWPPAGIALAAVYLFGNRVTPAITLAAFAVNFLTGAPILASVGIALGNSLEPLIGAWLLRSFRFKPLFSRLIDSFIFITVAISATTVSATIGTVSLGFTDLLAATNIPLTWLAWWVGDTISVLIVGPFLIRWLAAPISESRRSYRQFFEVVLFFVVIIVFTLLVFWEPVPASDRILSPYMLFVPLTWGALRVGPRAMTLAIATVAGLASIGTITGTGPFAPIVTGQELFLLGLFISTVSFIFLLFVSAVEERKNATKRLEENVVELTEDVQEISAADQAKNDFIATLSHELRNPLAPILSTLEIIQTGKVQSGELHGLINTTHENVLRMARLLDDLLDVARISRKQFTLQMGLVSLRSVVEHAASMTQPVIQKYNHSLIVEVPQDDVSLHVDQLRVEQVVVNLLNNAARYTPAGGTIVLSAAKKDAGGRTGAEIRVRDSGIGIPTGDLEKIFEPFQRLDTERSAESAGLGIGLSLAKRLTELHGGTISVKSGGKGKGSEFIVWLPAAHPVILLSSEEERQKKETPVPRRGRGSKKNVLIVDDNKEASEAIARLLNASGHEAQVAFDGVSALTRLANFRPDVIFLDIGLPGQDGYHIAGTIRNYLDPAPLIVALTGYGQEEDKQRARDAGFDDFLTKPVAIADLEKVLSRT